MTHHFNGHINLLPVEEQQLRLGHLRAAMATARVDAILVSDIANIYYLTGRVFSGYVYVTAEEMPVVYFVKRPSGLEGDGVVYIRKPEQIAESLELAIPASIGLELDLLPFSMASRLAKVFGRDAASIANASPVLRAVRAIKTPLQQRMMRDSAIQQDYVYRQVPKLYREGMTDIELQIEIERALRRRGCLGQFRISGDSMELYMANILVGENADSPTPYDFAMGGAGLDPSLPVGACGEIIREGNSVMVDANGNFTGYMTT